MAQRLKLQILDGPLIGQSFDVPPGRCSIGGKGSEATLELAGLPHGIRFIELIDGGSTWTIAEFEQRSSLLNQKPLKRRDKLSQDDVISLPSMTRGQPFRMRIEIEIYKEEKVRKKAKINPMVLAGVGGYLAVMVLVAVFFLLRPSGVGVAADLTLANVGEALQTDIASARANATPTGDVILDYSPTSFSELGLFLASGVPEARKTEISRIYSDTVVALFSDAWRFEQQGRFEDARARYQQVVSMMERRDLDTTDLALRRLNAIRGR